MPHTRPSRLRPRLLPNQTIRSNSTKPNQNPRHTLSSVSTAEQPTAVSEDGNRTLRTRQHGYRSLPLPPLIDPKVEEARGKWTGKKSGKYEGGRTEFQREVKNNAFAQALATPIRQCDLTRNRLPSHFLLPFVGILEPSKPSANIRVAKSAAKAPEAILTPVLPGPLSSSDSNNPPAQRSHRSYILSSPLALSRARSAQMVDEKMASWYAAKAGVSGKAVRLDKAFVWKEGIGEAVLGGLREDVVYRLRRGKGWESIGGTGERLQEEIGRALGQEKEKVDEAVGEEKKPVCLLKLTPELDPKPWNFADRKGIPIYDLTSLLDTASLAQLLELVPPLVDAKWVVVKKYDHSTGLAVALLKLKQYLAVHVVDSGGLEKGRARGTE